jgi:hypothetical protein
MAEKPKQAGVVANPEAGASRGHQARPATERRSPFEEMTDQLDRNLVAMTGDLDAQLRIARRDAKRRELRQLKAQAAQPVLPPTSPVQEPPPDRPPPRRRGRRQSDASLAQFIAIAHFAKEHGYFPTSAEQLADFAQERRLPHSKALDPRQLRESIEILLDDRRE